MRPRHRSKPGFDLDWVFSEVDVVMTSAAIVVVAASPVSKVYSAAETINNLAIASAPGAGFILALPLAVVAEAYEKLFGRHNNLDESALRQLFDVGRLLWIPKTDARFRYFEVNGGLFGECSNICAVSGSFRHKLGIVDMCLTASDDVLPRLSEVRKRFESPGYVLERTCFKKTVEVDRLLDKEYPFPNWSNILGQA